LFITLFIAVYLFVDVYETSVALTFNITLPVGLLKVVVVFCADHRTRRQSSFDKVREPTDVPPLRSELVMDWYH